MAITDTIVRNVCSSPHWIISFVTTPLSDRYKEIGARVRVAGLVEYVIQLPHPRFACLRAP